MGADTPLEAPPAGAPTDRQPGCDNNREWPFPRQEQELFVRRN
jgi:hypothetical protein